MSLCCPFKKQFDISSSQNSSVLLWHFFLMQDAKIAQDITGFLTVPIFEALYCSP